MTPPTPQSVIWIASYPKSGNTWVQAVVRDAGRRFGFPRKNLDVYKLIAENRVPDVVGGIQPDVVAPAPTVLKTHSRYTDSGNLHPQLDLKTAGFVHVIRNPLDLLLSYINFTRAQYERRRNVKRFQEGLFIDLLGYERIMSYEEWANVKLEDIPRRNLDYALARFTDSGTVIPGERMAGDSWLNHSFSWLTAGTFLPSVVLRYEDLLKGPEQFLPLQRLFLFPKGQIIKSVERVNVRFGTRQGKSVFFNKMSAYYYPAFFSRPAITRFLTKFEGDLRRLGYEDLPEGA